MYCSLIFPTIVSVEPVMLNVVPGDDDGGGHHDGPAHNMKHPLVVQVAEPDRLVEIISKVRSKILVTLKDQP